MLQRYAIIDGENIINVIEYDTEPGNPPPGFEEGIIAVQSDTAGPGWTYVNGEFVAPPQPPIPPEQLLEICRINAMARLSDTDWTELPSVSNTNITPHLTNVAEFMSYRNTVRIYAVTPVVDPIWPEKPVEQWSS